MIEIYNSPTKKTSNLRDDWTEAEQSALNISLLKGDNQMLFEEEESNTNEGFLAGRLKEIWSKHEKAIIASGTIVLLLLGVYLMVTLQPQFVELHNIRLNSSGGFVLFLVLISLFIYKLLFFSLNLYLYLRYRPVESVADDTLPICTVIVPAYNEGEHVYHTLKSLAASNYPPEKIQLIGIDDGSKDDTWNWLQLAKKELGARVDIYQQPRNMGKRHALYRGFNLAKGEVYVTVDSDSVVKKDTLRNLVSPFVTHASCGAVAGNVQVLNHGKGIIPKMLRVSFVFSFEFIRSAQSMMGTVLCTPGALSAYRASAVRKCKDEWLRQTFLGRPAAIGEDRAMTNMIMKQGFKILFQRNAMVFTEVPLKVRALSKMFTRWERSNVRENIMMGKFVFSRFSEHNKAGTRLLFFNQWLKIFSVYPFLVLMLIFVFNHPLLFLGSSLFSILLFSTFQAIFYSIRHTWKESVWAFSYSIFYSFVLFWITPYAIVTAKNSGWLTR
jgi:hyaluronan synthase